MRKNKKFELYDKGIYTYEDLINEDINWKYKQQVEFELYNNEPNLPVVHNGSEAMSIFAELGKYSKEEQAKIREGLLKYCELDTFAMVKIWMKLKEI